MGVPVVYRKSPFATANYDFYDAITGTAYINFYPAISRQDTGPSTQTVYTLVTDANHASDTNVFDVTTTTDIDFDIMVKKSFIIDAKECVCNWTENCGSGSTAQVTWTIHHVDASATETSLGSAQGEQTGASFTDRRSLRFNLTRKAFKRGEKLRVNANVAITGANAKVYFDPAGLLSTPTDADGRVCSSSAKVQIPIVPPI